jgi:hypothetical protein
MEGWQPPRLLSPEEIGARVRWATRRGNPGWLWSDVSVRNWRIALAMIALVARDALFDRPSLIVPDGDPVAFGLACYTSGMGPLLGWWQARGLLRATPEIGRLIEMHRRHNTVRNRRLATIGAEVTLLLSARRLDVIVLKGAHTAATYFPTPGARPMSDIDLLVRASDVAAVERVLAEAGFVSGKRGQRETTWRRPEGASAPRTLMFVHEDDPWSIDLHHSLDLVAAGGVPAIAFDSARPFETAAAPSPPLAARALDQPLLLLHLAAHAGAGLHSLSLLRLAELHYVIRRDSAAGRLSWPAFVEAGLAVGALGYAYPALRLCEDLAPGTLPAWVIERCAAAAPPRVARIVAGLTPATAQRVDRSSIAEHFMWSPGWSGIGRQLAVDLVPGVSSWRGAWAIYERRLWQLLHGRVGA